MRAQPNRNYVSNDVVMTPRRLADALVAELQPSGCVLEPCAGDGRFIEALREYLGTDDGLNDVWTCGDVRSGDPGFEWWTGQVDWVITNPPWSQFAVFLRKALQVSNDVAFLSTVNHWWTKRRVRDVRDAGFGYRRLILCDWPIEWPSSGFQLGMMHIQRGYTGGLEMIRLEGNVYARPESSGPDNMTDRNYLWAKHQ